jgi:hypothetical protein
MLFGISRKNFMLPLCPSQSLNWLPKAHGNLSTMHYQLDSISMMRIY